MAVDSASKSHPRGWIGVDLDGTLARYDGWTGDPLHIGAPIPAMVERVLDWHSSGLEVKIFTARVCDEEKREAIVGAIDAWCLQHLGRVLPVTNVKDYQMIALWDDRAVQVVPNTGKRVGCEHCEMAND